MRKLFTITTSLLLTIQASARDYKYITTETLNVREQAGKNYPGVGQINKGDRVTASTESSDWTEVETSNGIKGFVATKYLSSVKPQAATVAKRRVLGQAT